MAKPKQTRGQEPNLALGGFGSPSQTGTAGIHGADQLHAQGMNTIKDMEHCRRNAAETGQPYDWAAMDAAYGKLDKFRRTARRGSMTFRPGDQF